MSAVMQTLTIGQYTNPITAGENAESHPFTNKIQNLSW